MTSAWKASFDDVPDGRSARTRRPYRWEGYAVGEPVFDLNSFGLHTSEARANAVTPTIIVEQPCGAIRIGGTPEDMCNALVATRHLSVHILGEGCRQFR